MYGPGMRVPVVPAPEMHCRPSHKSGGVRRHLSTRHTERLPAEECEFHSQMSANPRELTILDPKNAPRESSETRRRQ